MRSMAYRIMGAVLCAALLLTALPLSAAAELTAPDNLPALYITLDNGVSQDSITHDDYGAAHYSLVGAEGFEDIQNAVLSIKGRGNSTWTLEKKPYALKLDAKTSLLGMQKSKKWCLLANYWDKTLMRNYLTLNLARTLGLTNTPECRFVDVYFNGVYRGNYLLTEKVEIGTGRVEIDTGKGGVLFEIEQQYRHSDCTYCHETASGVHLTYKEPEAADVGDEAISALMSANNTFLDELDQSLSQGIESWSKYIDTDSFVNWYILNEFTKNYDSAFVTSDYCYRESGGKLYMGPCWDYDTCYGNQDVLKGLDPSGYRVNAAPWYALLLRDGDFCNLLHKRYTELRDDGVFDQFAASVDTIKSEISASQKLDQAAWPGAMALADLRGSGTVYYTFDQEVGYLKNFINARLTWLDKMWNLNSLKQSRPLTCTDTVSPGSTGIQASAGMFGEGAENLFDQDTTTKFCTSTESEGMPEISFSLKAPAVVTAYSFATANDNTPARNPYSWTLYGSSDGSNFTILDQRKNTPLSDQCYTYTDFFISQPTAYQYYKLSITSLYQADANYMQLSELALSTADTSDLLLLQKEAESFPEALSPQNIDDAVKTTSDLHAAANERRRYICTDQTVTDMDEKVSAFLNALLPGDLNSDRQVTVTDALLALRVGVHKIPLNAVYQKTGELDGDGTVTVIDALRILQFSVGKRKAL